ncbi:MAG TPA: VOC family protein [Tepidisphaeraceae bacterium]|nr:VOC family protein [Tepidisphaeraceae bacterium]
MNTLFTGLDHAAISCRDVRKAGQWYCRHLGMRIIADNGAEPPSLLVGYDSGVRAGAMIELMPVKDAGPDPAEQARFQPGLRHLALRVSDFDAAYSQLKSGGVKFLFEPVAAIGGGGRIVSFRDLEGNELQIVERKA